MTETLDITLADVCKDLYEGSWREMEKDLAARLARPPMYPALQKLLDRDLKEVREHLIV